VERSSKFNGLQNPFPKPTAQLLSHSNFKAFVAPSRRDHSLQLSSASPVISLDLISPGPSSSIPDARQVNKAPQQDAAVQPVDHLIDTWSAAESEDLYGEWRPPAIQGRLKGLKL